MTLIHGQDGLLSAVAVDALRGPRVWVDDVELVDRVPSRVREDIHRLAGEQGVEVRVNFSGDPEVPAWGCRWVPRLTAARTVLAGTGS